MPTFTGPTLATAMGGYLEGLTKRDAELVARRQEQDKEKTRRGKEEMEDLRKLLYNVLKNRPSHLCAEQFGGRWMTLLGTVKDSIERGSSVHHTLSLYWDEDVYKALATVLWEAGADVVVDTVEGCKKVYRPNTMVILGKVSKFVVDPPAES